MNRQRIEQFLGTLTANESGLILGERFIHQAQANVAIAASTDTDIAAVVPFALGADEALLIEDLGGAFSCNDNSGQLSLISAQVGIGSLATPVPTVWWPIFVSFGSIPKLASALLTSTGGLSFYVQPPSAFRDKDVRGFFSSAVALAIIVLGTFRNNDAVNPHTGQTSLSLHSRVIGGVQP